MSATNEESYYSNIEYNTSFPSLSPSKLDLTPVPTIIPTNRSNVTTNGDGDDNDNGIIVGIAVTGAVIFTALLGGVIYTYYSNHNNHDNNEVDTLYKIPRIFSGELTPGENDL